MGKKKNWNEGPMSPDEAQDLINSIIEGDADINELNTESTGIHLFGLENEIFGEPVKKEEPERKTFREKATKKKGHHKPYKEVSKNDQFDIDDILNKAMEQNTPVSIQANVKQHESKIDLDKIVDDDHDNFMLEDDDEDVSEENTSDVREFNVTPVCAFGRAIIQDGISAFPFASDAVDNLNIDLSELEGSEINAIEILRDYVVSRAFPAAIFDVDKFEEEFATIEDYNEEKFLFFKEDDKVYAYVVADGAWSKFDEVILTRFEQDAVEENKELYYKAYLALTVLINNEHIGFSQGTEFYVPVYEADDDINLKDEFSELLFNDDDTVIRESTSSGIVPIKIDNFSVVAANIVAQLLGEDDDDEEEEESESDDTLIQEYKEKGEEKNDKEERERNDDREDRQVVSENGNFNRSVEFHRRKETEKEVEEADKATSEESLDESDEGDQESVSVDDLLSDDMEIIEPVKKGIDVMGKSSNDNNMTIPVERRH